MSGSHWGVSGLALLAALLGLPLAVSAEAVPGANEARAAGERDALIEVLLKKGLIDEADLAAIEREAAEGAEAEPLPAVSAEPEVDPKGYSIKHRNNLLIERNDGQIKIKAGGRIQADFASIWSDPMLQAAVANNGQGVEFRRARLFVSGEFYQRLIFKAQFEFAGSSEMGNTIFKDMYLGMKDLGPVGTVKVGHMKEPFSLEELTSSKYLTFMERGLPIVFDSSRNFGLMAQNHVLGERMTWAAGIFAPTNDVGSFFSATPAFNSTARITGLPFVSDDGSDLLHLGFSGSYQYRESFDVRYSQRPESHIAKAYLDTNTLMTNGIGLMAVELAWVRGPLSLQGEWKAFWLKNTTENNTSFLHGMYAEASYFLTGEHRAYERKLGVFARVSPKKRFNPLQGDWGAVQAAIRYSYLDLNDKNVSGGREQNVTLGVNWYLLSNVRLMLNYVYADVLATGLGTDVAGAAGQAHILESRAQVEF
jgi:phosphate-selective porin OprO/OprP